MTNVIIRRKHSGDAMAQKKRGRLNKNEIEAVDKLCRDKGFNPVTWLIGVAENSEIPWRERIRATIEINSCLNAKKKALDVDVDQTITLVRANFFDTLKGKNGPIIDTTSIPSTFLSNAGISGDGVGGKKVLPDLAQTSRKGQNLSQSDDRPDASTPRELLPLVPDSETGETGVMGGDREGRVPLYEALSGSDSSPEK